MVNPLKINQQKFIQYIAKDQAENLKLSLKRNEQIMERLVISEAVKRYSETFKEPMLLEYFYKFSGIFSEIAYLNEEGQELVKLVNGVKSEKLIDLSKTRLFEETTREPNKVFTYLSLPSPEYSDAYITFALLRQNYFNEFEGLFVGKITLSDFTKDIRDFQFGQTGFLILINKQGTILTYPKKNKLLQKVVAEEKEYHVHISQAITIKSDFCRDSILELDSYIAYAPLGKMNLALLAIMPYEEFMSAPQRLRNITLSILLAIVIMVILLSLHMTHKITKPISQLMISTNRIANGDLSTVTDINSNDEIGILAESFSNMTKKLKEAFAHRDQEITEHKKTSANLLKAKNEAEKANNIKSEFLANMSHELRTPMNGIIGMTIILLETELTNQQNEYLEMVRTAADSLLKIINNILDFSKIETKHLDIEEIEFDFRTTIDSLADTLSLKAFSKGLEFTSYIKPDVPTSLREDPDRLRQIIINLVDNAIKFTASGKISFICELESKEEECAILHFFISDTGIGMSEDKLKIIFESFRQIDGSFTRQYGGIGLGLSLSKNLIEMMGGRIWVETQLGKGSIFHFTIKFALQPTKNTRLEYIKTC